jgi:hypothetical protein
MTFRVSGRRLAVSLAALSTAFAIGGGLSTPANAQAIIDNGLVALGVNPEGNLITGGVGLTFLPSPAGSQDALTPGCACEAWGVADFATDGTANEFFGNAGESTGDRNLFDPTLIITGTGTDPRSTGDSALSTVKVRAATAPDTELTVTHDYHPSVDQHLYEVKVTIENTGTVGIDELRYRRAMDWDIPPTEFSEFVTIAGLPATAIVATSDNGFANGNPLDPTGAITAPENSNFEDNGPADHGATFDFNFGALDVGGMQSFVIFYGAAATEEEALAALRAVGAEVYSLGQPSSDGGAADGIPNTYIFAFAGVGGVPLGSSRSEFVPYYVDMPMLATGDHFRNLGLRLTGRLGGGELTTVGTVAAMMDGAPEAMGAASGDTMAESLFGVKGLRGFLTGSYNQTGYNTQGTLVGSNTDGFAVTGGVDYEFITSQGPIDSLIAGVGLGWSTLDSDIADAGSTVEGDGITLMLYSSATMFKQLSVDLVVGYSWLNYDSDRLAGGSTFSSDVDATDFGALGSIAYDIPVATGATGDLTFSPYLDTAYHYAEVDGFSESGGAGARTVEGYDADSLTTELGLRGEWRLPSLMLGETFVLRVHGGWVHEYLDDSFVIQQQIGVGTVTTTTTNDPDRDYGRVGGGVVFPFMPGAAVGVDYETLVGNDDFDHESVTLRGRVAF